MSSSVREQLEKLADDTEVNALGREELIKAEHTFEFTVGFTMGITRALELLKKEEHANE